MTRRLLWGVLMHLLWSGLSIGQTAPASAESPVAGSDNTAAQSVPDQSSVDWMDRSSWAIIFSGVALIVAFLTWRTAEKALVAGHRAWILITKIQTHHDDWNDPVGVNIHIVNCGQTPARDVRIAFEYVVAPKSPDKWPPLRPDSPRPLAPGSEVILTLDFEILRGSEKACRDIRNGDDCLYLFGQIGYRDVFGKERRTECARVYNPYRLVAEYFQEFGERNTLT